MSIETIVLCCIIVGNTLMQAGEMPPTSPEIVYDEPVAEKDFGAQEEDMIALINTERANASLPPVQENAALNEMAQVRLREIMVSFSHGHPSGELHGREHSQRHSSFDTADDDAYFYDIGTAPCMDH